MREICAPTIGPCPHIGGKLPKVRSIYYIYYGVLLRLGTPPPHLSLEEGCLTALSLALGVHYAKPTETQSVWANLDVRYHHTLALVVHVSLGQPQPMQPSNKGCNIGTEGHLCWLSILEMTEMTRLQVHRGDAWK